MGRNAIPIDADLFDYLVAHGNPPDDVMRDLAAETRESFPDLMVMQIGPEQCAFMTLLTKIIGVRQAVEVGTFTGMSSIAIARGMVPGGTLTCLDVSEEFTSVARRYWKRANLDEQIDLRLGDAREALETLPTEPYLDLAFVDADKVGYRAYWDAIVPRLRVGGVALVDNTLYNGQVADPTDTGESVVAIRQFNDYAAADDRVDVVIAPIGDGLTIARKR